MKPMPAYSWKEAEQAQALKEGAQAAGASTALEGQKPMSDRAQKLTGRWRIES